MEGFKCWEIKFVWYLSECVAIWGEDALFIDLYGVV